ncbi:ester cyclase [Bradyrhizobium sp. dw_78]|uniref:ester cyclase n=1 Tax=Bradyrhizobium sp. dw_78 TaxID=2719793 RepID=UPI00201C7731|nr:ester cyclase [Bradyrhizobium sp. dw_78]
MSSVPTKRENPMQFDGVMLSPQKEVVRKFYKDMWDHGDIKLVPEIFHDDFTFRGSLGPVLIGHAQFSDYVLWVRNSLENYTSDIISMVEENDQVMGKLHFHGVHRQPLFGCAPTGQDVGWDGVPIFTFDGGKVRDLWVLGDIYGLLSRMQGDLVKRPEFAAK